MADDKNISRHDRKDNRDKKSDCSCGDWRVASVLVVDFVVH